MKSEYRIVIDEFVEDGARMLALISDAFHLEQRVTESEAFGIVRSKFIGPLACLALAF
jgi:hypothetical protein